MTLINAVCFAAVIGAAVAGPFEPLPGAYAPYLCNVNLAQADGATYNFDLRPVADLTLSLNGGYNYTFSPCGVPTGFACNPSWGQVWRYQRLRSFVRARDPTKHDIACIGDASTSGVAFVRSCEHALTRPDVGQSLTCATRLDCIPRLFVPQVWPYGPGYQLTNDKPPGGMCWNNQMGMNMPCTQYCEPLGSGVPQHQLIDPMNAAAGILTVYPGFRSANGDFGKCPWDPVRGRELGRSFQVLHTCDASVPKGQAKLSGINENPPCSYIASISVGVLGCNSSSCSTLQAA